MNARPTSKSYFQIRVPKSVKAKELNEMSWQSLLFYHFLRCHRRNQGSNERFINFQSTLLQKKYTNAYRRHIDDLIGRGWIEVNPRYKNDKDGFTKSYRISGERSFYAEKHKKFSVPLIRSVWKRFEGSFMDDLSDQSDEYLRLVKERHDTLYIPATPVSHEGKLLKTKLQHKRANVHYEANGRVSSTIIKSRKPTRKYVLFGDRGKLVNIDVSGMIHQILNSEIRSQKWNNWIEHDFPKEVGTRLRLRRNRKTIKRLIIKALGKGEFQYPVPQIRSLLRAEFPIIMAHVDHLNSDGTVQGKTQRIESQVIKEFITKYRGINMIPAHDGVFCGDLDAYETKVLLERFLKRKGMVGKVNSDSQIAPPPTIVDLLMVIADESHHEAA